MKKVDRRAVEKETMFVGCGDGTAQQTKDEFWFTWDAVFVSEQVQNPADLMETAINWLEYARQHGWVLKKWAKTRT